ncbi:hypothetical protein DPEC_G00321280 [Dallia pectoralis]|uniref:Uncharacterized protein n=1 Tax=Dallia pectoralis TaxID=75939 RepID=A0ACC2FA59_DALPE|nr:hypothetical protein DPEC_G00321280 [Dallia pectoralis]
MLALSVWQLRAVDSFLSLCVGGVAVGRMSRVPVILLAGSATSPSHGPNNGPSAIRRRHAAVAATLGSAPDVDREYMSPEGPVYDYASTPPIVPQPKPSSTQPSSTQPSSTQPSSTQPSSTQPSSTQPSSTQPSSTRLSSNQPILTKPSSTQSSSTQSSSTQFIHTPSAAASFFIRSLLFIWLEPEAFSWIHVESSPPSHISSRPLVMSVVDCHSISPCVLPRKLLRADRFCGFCGFERSDSIRKTG